ncbi:MAG: hypothetical protein RMI39_09135 [Thermoanaerobaculum sp.]|nr:hypothetical protein [Thermoanaerobaculum sp.]
MEQLPDERLAEAYELTGVVQRSETTVVFRARARSTGDPVIAKVLRLAGTGVSEVHRIRFLKAVSALIKHAPAGVPPLKDAAWGSEAAVLLFLPVPGTRFTQLSHLAPGQAARFLARAAESLETLHAAGVAHGNLAPDNLLVLSMERVFLTGLGWGFARLPASGAAFAAPELRKAVDVAEPHRCDLFSLAQVAAEVFGARVTYQEEEAQVLLPPTVLEQLAEAEKLQQALARCLHLDPFERPVSARELAEALHACVPEAVLEEEGTVRLLPEEEPAASAPTPTDEAGTVILAAEVLQPADQTAEGEVPALGPGGQGAQVEGSTSGPAEMPSSQVSQLPPVPPAVATEAGSPTPPRAAVTLPAQSRRLWPVALGAGLLVLLAVLGVLLIRPSPSREAPAPMPVVPTPVVARPSPPLPEPAQVRPGAGVLAEAKMWAAEERWEEVRQALAALNKEELLPEERQVYDELRARLSLVERKQALVLLRSAWNGGNLTALRKALRDFEQSGAGEEGLPQEERFLLQQARAVQQAVARMQQEEKAQRWEAVLQEAQKVERLLPGTREVATSQERAAQAMEAAARTAQAQGNLQQALALLQALERLLPARPGLSAKIAELREAQARQEQLAHLLQQAERLGEAGKPEQGLALLADAPAWAESSGEVKRLRDKLSQQLAALDAGAPVVAPPTPAFKWEYLKGQVAKVEVKVSDDHGVARVTLFFRKKGEKGFRSTPMTKTSAGTFVGEIVPAVHANEDLEFYVLAEDHSGHQGLLASAEKPADLRRKRGLFGF